MGLILVDAHNIDHIWLHQGIIVFFEIDIPKFAAFVSQFQESRIFRNFEFLLKESCAGSNCRLFFWFDNIWTQDFDESEIDIRSKLGTITFLL